MYQTIVKNFSSLFIQYLPCIHTTQLEEPTIPITLICLHKKKLYCGQQWCQLHLVRSLFCTIVSFIVINTSVHHHWKISGRNRRQSSQSLQLMIESKIVQGSGTDKILRHQGIGNKYSKQGLFKLQISNSILIQFLLWSIDICWTRMIPVFHNSQKTTNPHFCP